MTLQAVPTDISTNERKISASPREPYGSRCSACISAIKKTLFHPKADVIERLRFQTRIRWYEDIEGRPIVYLDESGFAVDAPRTHGYSQQGVRCYGEHNWHEKGRLNAIGAILAFKFIAIQLWECNIDADVFLMWVRKALLPAAPPRSVIVLDRATFHRRSDIPALIERKGHTVEYLPAYSPDFNPIEKKWSQAKAIRRRERCDPHKLFLCKCI